MTDMGAQLSNDYIHRKMTMSEHFKGKCNLQQEIHRLAFEIEVI